jgi:hypothetical protein
MQAERDQLVRFAFPRLRQELLRHRIHLVDVDLRWGVTSDQNASHACLDLIDQCRPRFLCLLGGRYGWIPEGETRSITEAEIKHGALDLPSSERRHCHFYFRTDAATAAMIEDAPGVFREPSGGTAERKLRELKRAIAKAGFKPRSYVGVWDPGRARLTGLKPLADAIFADLMEDVRNDPSLGEHFRTDVHSRGESDERRLQADDFIERQSEEYVLGSRQRFVDDIFRRFSAAPSSALCISGASGIGKSAFMVNLLAELSKPKRLAKPPMVLCHFVGIGPGSTTVAGIVRRFYAELSGSQGVSASIQGGALEALFHRALQRRCENGPVVIVVDALDQLDAIGNVFSWLPGQLPEGARLLVSAKPGPVLERLREEGRFDEVPLPPLDRTDALEIVTRFCARYGKRLDQTQTEALLGKAGAGIPLYLRAALEELRTLGQYDEISRRIDVLPSSADALFAWMLDRLAADDLFCDAEGRLVARELVCATVACLAAARHGLSQAEIVDLVAPGDPLGNVAALLRLLRPYLMDRGDRIDFYHTQFREAAEAWAPRAGVEARATHAKLAEYFQNLADPGGDQSWRGDRRPLAELLFHRANGDAWEEALGLIQSPAFVGRCNELDCADVLLSDGAAMRRRAAACADGPNDGVAFQLEAMLALNTVERIAGRGGDAELGNLPAARVMTLLSGRIEAFERRGPDAEAADALAADICRHGISNDAVMMAGVRVLAPKHVSAAWRVAVQSRNEAARARALAVCLSAGSVPFEDIRREVERLTTERMRGMVLEAGARLLDQRPVDEVCKWIDGLFSGADEFDVLGRYGRHLATTAPRTLMPVLKELRALSRVHSLSVGCLEASQTALLLSRSLPKPERLAFLESMATSSDDAVDDRAASRARYQLAIELCDLNLERSIEIVCGCRDATDIANAFAVFASRCKKRSEALALAFRAAMLVDKLDPVLVAGASGRRKWRDFFRPWSSGAKTSASAPPWPFASKDPLLDLMSEWTLLHNGGGRGAVRSTMGDRASHSSLAAALSGEFRRAGEPGFADAFRAYAIAQGVAPMSPKALGQFGRERLEASTIVLSDPRAVSLSEYFLIEPGWLAPLNEPPGALATEAGEIAAEISLVDARRAIEAEVVEAMTRTELRVRAPLPSTAAPCAPTISEIEARDRIEALPQALEECGLTGRGFRDAFVLRELQPVFQAWLHMERASLQAHVDRLMSLLHRVWSHKRDDVPVAILDAAAKANLEVGLALQKRSAMPVHVRSPAYVHACRLSACSCKDLAEALALARALVGLRECMADAGIGLARLYDACEAPSKDVLTVFSHAVLGADQRALNAIVGYLDGRFEAMDGERRAALLTTLYDAIGAAKLSSSDDCAGLLGWVPLSPGATDTLLAAFPGQITSLTRGLCRTAGADHELVRRVRDVCAR